MGKEKVGMMLPHAPTGSLDERVREVIRGYESRHALGREMAYYISNSLVKLVTYLR